MSRPSRRDESGQVTLLVIGFATVIAMAIVLVVDASAAYLQRSGLDTLADGAALHGADLGATGVDVYTGGVPEQRLALTQADAQRAVEEYLGSVGAYRSYPGLVAQVAVADGDTVQVELSAPLDLPLSFPGSPAGGRVAATGSAVSTIE
ncbi:pilus assembly protein TadG-related protein [Nocardioides sp. W7]|uniref:pilus assembly protein TadG-related protein n=1 Tax=Nocardioides sp. W7 TaxID=2931390 RepID=UPI001FD5ED78|nr:pilus assembly protein TadG-related protein [Nocardioides sp. W7]